MELFLTQGTTSNTNVSIGNWFKKHFFFHAEYYALEFQLMKNPDYTHIPQSMTVCEQKSELQQRLKAALEDWYAVKDVPGKNREAKAAEKKVHHVQRSLGDHVAKHGCNRES